MKKYRHTHTHTTKIKKQNYFNRLLLNPYLICNLSIIFDKQILTGERLKNRNQLSNNMPHIQQKSKSGFLNDLERNSVKITVVSILLLIGLAFFASNSSTWVFLFLIIILFVSISIFYISLLWRLTGIDFKYTYYFIEVYVAGLLFLAFVVGFMILTLLLLMNIEIPTTLNPTYIQTVHDNLIVVSSILIAIIGFLHYKEMVSIQVLEYVVLASISVIIFSFISLIAGTLQIGASTDYLEIMITEIVIEMSVFRTLYKGITDYERMKR